MSQDDFNLFTSNEILLVTVDHFYTLVLQQKYEEEE